MCLGCISKKKKKIAGSPQIHYVQLRSKLARYFHGARKRIGHPPPNLLRVLRPRVVWLQMEFPLAQRWLCSVNSPSHFLNFFYQWVSLISNTSGRVYWWFVPWIFAMWTHHAVTKQINSWTVSSTSEACCQSLVFLTQREPLHWHLMVPSID